MPLTMDGKGGIINLEVRLCHKREKSNEVDKLDTMMGMNMFGKFVKVAIKNDGLCYVTTSQPHLCAVVALRN